MDEAEVVGGMGRGRVAVVAGLLLVYLTGVSILAVLTIHSTIMLFTCENKCHSVEAGEGSFCGKVN